MAAASPRAPHEAGRAAGWQISRRFPRRLFAKLLETSLKLAMDVAAAALPAFVALWLLSPWPLLGSVQGQFSAGEWTVGVWVYGCPQPWTPREEGLAECGSWGRESRRRSLGERGAGWIRRDAGLRAERHPAQVTFPFLTHCFRSWPRAQTPLGVLMERVETLLFLGEVLVAWASGAVHTALVKEERKKKYLRLAGPRFYGSPSGLAALCHQTVQKIPQEAFVRIVGSLGTDLGAHCQVLFVPGITSSDCCPSTSLCLLEAPSSSAQASELLLD